MDIGGAVHSLVALEAACKNCHAFTNPTLYRQALWLPYRRDEQQLRQAIAEALEQGPVQAIFAHADVVGRGG